MSGAIPLGRNGGIAAHLVRAAMFEACIGQTAGREFMDTHVAGQDGKLAQGHRAESESA